MGNIDNKSKKTIFTLGLVILFISSIVQITPNFGSPIEKAEAGSIWTQTTEEDFKNCTLIRNLVINSTGKVHLPVHSFDFKDDYIYNPKILNYNNTIHDESIGEIRLSINPVNEQWNKTYGGIYSETTTDVCKTNDGGYTILGGIDYGGPWPPPTSIYLLKVNDTWVEQWNTTFETGGRESASSIENTSDGGFIIAGSTYSYGPKISNYLLIKFNKTGVEQWNRTFGKFDYNYGYSAYETNDGGYIIAGYTTYMSSSPIQVWIIKMNDTGIEQWNKTYGGPKTDTIRTMIKTSDGGYVIGGYTHSYASTPAGDIWLLKINESGVEEWNRTYGGIYSDICWNVYETQDGGFAIIGESGSDNIYVVKTNKTGIEEWNRTYFGQGTYIIQTNDSGYIVTGYQNEDLLLIKLNKSGGLVWKKIIGGNDADQGRRTFENKNGELIIWGSTASYGAGGYDIWLIKTDNVTLQNTNGTATSINIFGNYYPISINWFNCTTVNPINSSIKIQFSRDKNNWYNSTGVLDGWDETSDGINSINLTNLNWNGSNFFYKALFSTNNTISPSLRNISLNYNSYYSTGDFESQIFNVSGNVSWKNITWSGNEPNGTSIRFQLRSAKFKINLPGVTYSGPNGDKGMFYESPGSEIWSGHNGDNFLQYRAVLSTLNHSITPTLFNVTIHYNYWPEQPTLIGPINNTMTRNPQPKFNWLFKDIDSNTQESFQWQMDHTGSFHSPDYDSGVINSSSAFFKPGFNITEGVWFWRVRTKDNDGDWGPFSQSWKIIIDKNDPISNITFPINNSYYPGLKLINGTAEDAINGSGLNRVEILLERLSDNKFWNGSDWNGIETWLLTNGTTKWSYDLSSVSWTSNSNYRVLSKAIDNSTNNETPSEGIVFSIDLDKPTSTIINPLNNSFVNRWKLGNITGTTIDKKDSGVNHVEILIKRLSDNKFWDNSIWISSECWLNTSGISSWSYDVSMIGFTSGVKYLLKSRSIDNASNVENSSYGIIFTFDSSKPSSNVINPINGYYYNNSVPISGTSSDSIAGINFVELAIKRVVDSKYWSSSGWISVENWLLASGTETWSYDGTNVSWASGWQYYIISRAADNASNVETPSSGSFIYSDLHSPISSIIDPINGIWLNNLSRIKGTFADIGPSGIKSIELLIKNNKDDNYWSGSDWVSSETWLSTIISGTDWSYDTSSIFWLQDTKYIAISRAMDSAFNYELSNPSIEFYFDFEKPKSTIINPIQNEILNELKSISGTAEDAGGSGFYIRLKIQRTNDGYYWSGLKWVSEERRLSVTGLETWSFDTTDVTWSSDNSYTIYSTAYDGAGNQETQTNTITFFFDDLEPSISILINDDYEFTNSSNIILTMDAADSGSGVNQVCYSTDNKIWTPWESFLKSKNFQLLSIDGEQSVYYRVKDLAGNIAVTSDTIILDTNQPIIADFRIDHGNDLTNSKKILLNFNATDGLSGISEMSFSLDGLEWTTWEKYIQFKYLTIESPDGEKTIYIRVKDKAVNIAEAKDSITLDMTPPHSLSINITKHVKKLDETTIVYHLSAIDDISGVSKMAFTTNINDWENWMDFRSNLHYIILGFVNETVYFKVKDYAGNEADPISTNLIIDRSDFFEFIDTDGDGVLDKDDAFPNDDTQWLDTDGDNYGDNLNGKNPDYYPNDPTKWEKEDEPPDNRKPDDKPQEEDSSWLIVSVVILMPVVIIIVIILLFLFLLKRKKKGKGEQDQQTQIEENKKPPSQIKSTIQPQLPILQPQLSSTQQKTQPQYFQKYPTQYQPMEQQVCLTCGQPLIYNLFNNNYYCPQCQRF